MKRYTFCIIIFIFALSIFFTDTAISRPDGHAPIGVMGEQMIRTQVDVIVHNLSL